MIAPKTLIIDDNPSDRSLALRALKKLFPQLQYWEISDELGFAKALQENKFNLVITDYQLCWTTGQDLVERIKKQRPDCPIIMFTGTGSEEIAVSAMKAGLDDYVIKSPEHYIRLAAAARSAWQRSQQQKALDEFKQSYDRFFERVPLGLYRLNSQGEVLKANSSLLQMFGYSQLEDFQGKSLLDYHLEADSYLSWQQQLIQEATVEFEAQIQSLKGELKWIRHHAIAIKDQEDNLIYYEGAISDITANKQAELERIELLNRERQAREEAETVNRIKDEFLATLSHELRTPLNAIMGWTQLLSAGHISETQISKAIDVIERNAKAQDQLIDDLLDVARIIRGSMKLELKKSELTEIVMASIDTVRPTAEAKNITIETQIDTQSISVKVDRARLQQVFWNLLINAVKFTPANGKVTISSSIQAHTVSIKITDTGQGIATEVLPYVFDRFRQAETQSSTRTKGGLGLGLAIVRHLVEIHGGRVIAQSDGIDQGATFVVELPLLSKITANLAQSSSTLNSAFPSLQGLKLLVVEDEADALEVVTLILEQCGAKVISADSVEQALIEYNQQQPDILISDISMPSKDGYELIKQIRDAQNPIPAIALTANVREEDRQKALKAGFNLHLPKPINPLQLIESLLVLAKK
jgi:PAS domain S-box-containing protein